VTASEAEPSILWAAGRPAYLFGWSLWNYSVTLTDVLEYIAINFILAVPLVSGIR